MASRIISDFALGDAVFYSFGNAKMQPYVSTFRDETHFKDIIHNYRYKKRKYLNGSKCKVVPRLNFNFVMTPGRLCVWQRCLPVI